MAPWQEFLAFARTVGQEVGASLLADFDRARGGAMAMKEKADGSAITDFDRAADDRLRAAIERAYPDFGLLAEESHTVMPDREWCWVVDPIDGTTNFARGVPIWAISLGLLHWGRPVFGYVTVPPLGHSFYGWLDEADRGEAFFDGVPLHVSRWPAKIDGNSLFSCCSRSLAAIGTRVPCKLRMLGVASYNLLTVAIGATVGAVEATPKVWDLAAARTVLAAAGATWVPLGDRAPFPLVPGEDYGDRSYPVLVVRHPDMLPVVQPLVAPLSAGSPSAS